MKKLLFAAHSLDIGGIEKALVTLLNRLSQIEEYEITLVLEKKEGVFLENLDNRIKVIEYKPYEKGNKYIRKIKNMFNRIKFILKYHNKFDFSAAYATYSLPACFIAKVASKNSALWVHADYMSLFKNDEEKVKDFFNKRKCSKFKNIVCVSKESRDSFVKVFEKAKENAIICNNYIDYKKIIDESNEKIDLKVDNNIPIFLNVGRHDEIQKKLTRLFEAAKKLNEDGLDFRIVLVGDGPDTEMYKKIVKDYELDDKIIFEGRKQNPYPYYKNSNYVILTSDYEGYPVVFLESFILQKPIITTDVSDYEQVEGRYGIVTKKDSESIYEAMKKCLKEGVKLKENFDPEKYNQEILEKLQRLF